MKKCTQCGRESMSEAKFCEFCGSKFPEEQKEEKAEIKSESLYYNMGEEAPPLPELEINKPRAGETRFNEGVRSNDGPPPTNKGLVWLIVSSVMTLLGCCCIPPGGFLHIATIITSAISVSRYKNADYEGAEKMAKVSMIVFLSILGLSLLLLILLAATGSLSEFSDSFSETYSEFY